MSNKDTKLRAQTWIVKVVENCILFVIVKIHAVTKENLRFHLFGVNSVDEGN